MYEKSLDKPQAPPCRLSVILARKAPVGVILRRGPTRWVQLIKWQTDRDEFESGQWFHGRIYESACDLSPNGALLLYVAAQYHRLELLESTYSDNWTAVSKPPYLTALALWPLGANPGGGGLFIDDRTLRLQHGEEVGAPHPDHMPRGLEISSDTFAEKGCDGVYLQRMRRDGWSIVGEPGSKRRFRFQKRVPRLPMRLVMQCRGRLGDEVDSISIVDDGKDTEHALNSAVWADTDQQGRIVFARHGRLFSALVRATGELVETELADFNEARPEAIAAPERARHW